MPKLDKRVEAVALNMEGLLKLLGGSSDDRDRFWGIIKGITTPAQYRLTNAALVAVQTQLKSAHDVLSGVHTAAGEISKEQAKR
jgi:hypothetical protein